jgi:hypothetical protein
MFNLKLNDMNKLKQLIKNLRYLCNVDLRRKERVIDEVRDFLKNPRRKNKPEKQRTGISNAAIKYYYQR